MTNRILRWTPLLAAALLSGTALAQTATPAAPADGDRAAAKIEADAPAHPTWEPEVTFESLLDLFEFVPEREVHRIAPRKLLLVTPEHDPVIAGDELRSMAAKAGPTAELLVLAGARHSDVYGRARDVVVEAALQALAAGL